MKEKLFNPLPVRGGLGRGFARGMRNNNPCNIRRSADRWQGMAAEQTDKEFVQFTKVEYGLRAVWKTLQTYYAKHGCDTLRKAITRWAPPHDGNATERYVDFVSSHAYVLPDQPLGSPLGSHDTLAWASIIGKMCVVESQWHPSVWQLTDAYRMAMEG